MMVFFAFIVNIQISFANEAICHVVTDRKVYMTNEVVYGSVIFENQYINGKVVRVIFKKIDQEKSLSEFCIKFDKNAASFYIPITSEYDSGTYQIEFWACKTENKRGASLIHLGNSFLNIVNIEDAIPNRNAFYDFATTLKFC